MNPDINIEGNEEIKIKKSEEVSHDVPKPVRVDLDEDLPDFATRSRKLRLVLNKISEDNCERLVSELVLSFEFNRKLLTELIRLIFDRATSRNFIDLYLSILIQFSSLLKPHSPVTYKAFKAILKEKCSVILTINDPSLVPLCKFIALLSRDSVIKHTIILQFFELAVTDSASEFQIEAACHFLKTLGSYLAAFYVEKLEKHLNDLSQICSERFPRKLQFLILDVVENKQNILAPCEPKYSAYMKKEVRVAKGTGKGVSFAMNSGFEPVQSRNAKRILKQGISEEIKVALKEAVAGYMSGKMNMEVLKAIFKECKNKERLLVNQIFKYALIQFDGDHEFLKVCEMVLGVCEAIDNKDAIETGIMYTVEAINDIKLDSPMASLHLNFIISHLHSIGVILNSKYLLDYVNT